MSTERKQPEWLDNAVFYEIYPQSFRDTNADGIGDFNGIIEKLDYIKELGCTALWLNPCFLSPFGDAGYDVEDYYTVAPRYGTNEDLVHLFEEAHKRQMHVLLDLVPGEEFIRRFLMHVPPKRFVRIRHYGLLSCRNKSKKMTHCRNLLGCKKYISALKNRSATEMIKLLYNIDVCRCSSCGGKMIPHLPDKHTPSVLAHMRC